MKSPLFKSFFYFLFQAYSGIVPVPSCSFIKLKFLNYQAGGINLSTEHTAHTVHTNIVWDGRGVEFPLEVIADVCTKELEGVDYCNCLAAFIDVDDLFNSLFFRFGTSSLSLHRLTDKASLSSLEINHDCGIVRVFQNPDGI